MESRLSEDFGSFEPPGNRSSPPSLFFSPGGPTSLQHYAKPNSLFHKKPRRDPSDKAGSQRTSLPGPPNLRESYAKTREAIRAYLKTAPQESIEQLSSCASVFPNDQELQAIGGLPNPEIHVQRRGQVFGIFPRMRMAVVKWQSRKQFFEFTSDSRVDKEQSTIHAWRRRRTLVEQMLLTSSKGEEWAALIARRFNKTTTRQIAGLHAILRLREEEEIHNSPGIPYNLIKFEYCGGSYGLLMLVFVRFQPESFFQDAVSSVLRDRLTHEPWVIIWLVNVIPNFMRRVNPGLMFKYGHEVIHYAMAWTNQWLHGLWLLLALFIGQVASKKDRTNILSVGKLILHVGMEAFGNLTSDAAHNHPKPHVESKRKVLSSILSTCWNCDGEEFFQSILPSTIILEPFAEACVNALCANDPLTCSALKALALLRNIPTGMENLPPAKMSALASSCMNIVLGGGFWDKSAILEECGPNSFNLIPEEDAFDILCRLPQPTFSTALAVALDNCPVSLDPSSQDHLKLFDILEPLLWLSNMPASIPEAHHALVTGGACEFLAKIILDSPQEAWSWKDRAIWRVKGEAITCFGNIIEKMDQAELRLHLREDSIKAIGEIRDNTEAPLVQRDQATFTLRRYIAAAARCSMELLCKEMLAQEPEVSNDEEGQNVWRVTNVHPHINAVRGAAS